MYKLKLLLLPVAWLLAFMAFACAPPDDDDAPSSGPTINNAIYDVGTALLTIQGTNLSPTEAQIQTIVVDGVALSSYSADDPATGPDSSDLVKGKYRLKSDGTAIWLYLTDTDKAALNGKTGMDSNGLKKGLLSVSSGAWAGLNIAKGLAVSGNPTITRASYNVGTALLTLQGTDLGSATQAQIQTIKVYGVALSSYTADDDATGPDSSYLVGGKYRLKSDGTAIWLRLTYKDKNTLHFKPGMYKGGLKDGKLTSTGTWAGLDTAKALAVSGHRQPVIYRAFYNANTGKLIIFGGNLPYSVEEWDFSKLTLVSGDRKKRFTLPKQSTAGEDTATGSDASAIKLLITLSGSVKAKANAILVKDGLRDNNGAYNLEAAAGFAGGSAEDDRWRGSAEDIWDNPITVRGYTASITKAKYDANTGKLIIFGKGLPETVEEWDFSKLTLVSGDGSKRFTLPQKSTAGENTATGYGASEIDVYITLSGSVKEKANAILVNDGDSDGNGAYNLEAAAGFAGGRSEDTSNNPITVSGYVSQIYSVVYFANKGKLYIYGSRLSTAVADWDFSKLTLVSGDGSKYTLPRHSTAGANTATGSRASALDLLITLSGSVKAEVEKILVRNGESDDNGAYNLEAAAEFVPGSQADSSNNPITVIGYVARITSVLYIAIDNKLYINGSRLPTAVADWDFSKLTIVSGDGKKRFTLPKQSTSGENTATGSDASATGLTITLSDSVKEEVDAILVNNGNFEAAAGFVPDSPKDSTTSIEVL